MHGFVILGDSMVQKISVLAILAAAVVAIGFAVRAYLKSRIVVGEMNQRRREEMAQARDTIEEISRQLSRTPEDQSLHNNLTTLMTRFPELSEKVYHAALLAVEQSKGASKCKTFALEVGRAYFGSMRPDQLATTYDEQAIQNDIGVRSN